MNFKFSHELENVLEIFSKQNCTLILQNALGTKKIIIKITNKNFSLKQTSTNSAHFMHH